MTFQEFFEKEIFWPPPFQDISRFFLKIFVSDDEKGMEQLAEHEAEKSDYEEQKSDDKELSKSSTRMDQQAEQEDEKSDYEELPKLSMVMD